MKFNTTKFNSAKFNEEIYNLFSGSIDVENEEIKKLRNEIEALQKENKDMKLLLVKQKHDITNLQNNPKNKKYSLDKIKIKFQTEYDFLSSETLECLMTAEYLFLNENDDIDYSGVYTGYIKALEIELRKRLSVTDNMTFGSLIRQLEKTRIFNSFTTELNKNTVIDNRNRGVHSGSIKKIECGRIRKILLEDGWLARIVDYFTNFSSEKNLEDEDEYEYIYF